METGISDPATPLFVTAPGVVTGDSVGVSLPMDTSTASLTSEFSRSPMGDFAESVGEVSGLTPSDGDGATLGVTIASDG